MIGKLRRTAGQHKRDHSLMAPGRLEVGAVGGRGDAGGGSVGQRGHHVLRELDLWVWVLGAQAGGGFPLEILKRAWGGGWSVSGFGAGLWHLPVWVSGLRFLARG